MKLSVKNLAVIMAGLLLPVFVWAVESIPHQFYGTVNFENGASPDGLLIEVKIDNVVVGSSVTNDGKYGYSSIFYITDLEGDRIGKTIKFYVNGIDSGETFVFSNGASTNLNLTVPGRIGTIVKNEGETVENEEVVVTPQVSTNIQLGTNLSVTISPATNTNATATVEKIEKKSSGNVAIFSGKNFLNAYEIKITGESLNISVTMKYDDAGIDEDTIVPYWFNATSSSWVVITPFTIDKTANTITFTISSGQTVYGVFGSVVQAAPSGGGTTGGGGGGGGETTPPAATFKKGDADKNNKVDIFDFNILMVNWGNNPTNAAADFDGNGKVDIFDFNILMVNWG